MNITQITAIIQMVEAIAGGTLAKAALDLFAGRATLTEEQKANLESNYRDYVERITRLKAEG